MTSRERNSLGDKVMDRRQLLRASAGAALLGTAPGLLAACGSDSDDSGANTAGSSASPTGAVGALSSAAGTASAAGGGSSSTVGSGLPASVPWQVLKYDLPGATGVPPAAFAYPADPKRIHDGPVVKDLAVSILKEGDTAQPPTGSHNPFLQYLQKQIGATLNITQIGGSGASDYASKLATTLASGDLPDLFMIPFSWPNLVQTLRSECADLTPFLGGDGVKNWPALAALPTFGWQGVTISGGLWGSPFTVLERVGFSCLIRQDIFDALGAKPDISNGDDFMALCKELTDVKSHRWALTDLLTSTVHFVSEMTDVPNDWKEENGKFTSAYEVDQYKQMMEYVNQIYTKGYVYPNTTTTLAQAQTLLMGGTGVMMTQQGSNWSNLKGRASNAKFNPGGLVLLMWDGSGQAVQYMTSGTLLMMNFKKAKASRIKQLLNVVDWFASPWGSSEQELAIYGMKGRDYTLKATDPVATRTGITECFNFRLDYIATAPQPLYTPGFEDITRRLYAYELEVMKNPAPLVTDGLYSATVTTKGAAANKVITNVMHDIIMGRKKVSEWDAAVKTWRNNGGDQVRAEYEKAFVEKNGGK